MSDDAFGDAFPSDAGEPGGPGARGEEHANPSAVRRRGEGVRPFRLPAGVEMIEGENYRHREAYDVVYLKDDETPRYRYTVGVSADRVAELFVGLAGLLPQKVCVVLEIPAPAGDAPAEDGPPGDGPVEDGPGGDGPAGDGPGEDGPGAQGSEACDVWVSPPVDVGAALAEFRAHERVLVHDGMVGFGLVAPVGPDHGRADPAGPPGPVPADGHRAGGDGLRAVAGELFIDEHKLVFLYAREMDGADAVLSRLGVKAADLVRHFSELSHVHVSLASKGAGEPYWEVARGLRDRLGLAWEESREYT